MAPKPHESEIMPLELDLGSGNMHLGDKSPMKPRRQMSESDLNESMHMSPPPTPTSSAKPSASKSHSPGAAKRSLRKKKKSKSVDCLPTTSNHSNASGGKKKKKLGTKKKKKKKKLSSKNNMSDDDDEVELPLNDEIPHDSPLRLPGKRRRRKAIPSRHGSLKRNNSLPTMTASDSDGDSTLEGSWCDGAASFSDFNDWNKGEEDEPSPRTKAKNKMPFEIEAFLDQIINDASKPKSPITSIRKKAHGRTLKKKKGNKNNNLGGRPGFERAKSETHLDVDDELDLDLNLNHHQSSGKKQRGKPLRQRCNSTGGHRVVSLSIAGEGEKTFTLSGDDLGMIEAFLKNKSKDNPQQQQQPTLSPTRSQASSNSKKQRSTSASRAAKRAELFDDDLSRSQASSNKHRSTSATRAAKRAELFDKPPSETTNGGNGGAGMATAVRRKSHSNRLGSLHSHADDSLIGSERVDSGHQKASMLPHSRTRLAQQMRRMSGSQMRRMSGGRGGGAVRRMSGGYVSNQPPRPRSKSVGAGNNWREIHANRLSLLELESMSDGEEGSYSLTQGRTARRWSLSDSMSISLSSHGLLDKKNMPLDPVENRFFKKDLDINGPFNVVKAPRKGRRKPGGFHSDSNLGFDSMHDDEVYTDVPKRRSASPSEVETMNDRVKRRSRSGGRKPGGFHSDSNLGFDSMHDDEVYTDVPKRRSASPSEVETMNDRVKRRSRSGGRRPRKPAGNVPKSLWSGEDDEDESIENSPGIFRATVKETLLIDDEASNIEQSCRGQTLEQLMMSPNDDSNIPKTPSKQQRETKQRGSKTSTPNGAQIYKLDLGEARWTTTPTGQMKGKNRQKADPLDLHLPFSEENGGRSSGILKTHTLGLVEPATFRNSAIRNKKRLKKRGIEEGDILVCDDDNATVVSDITEAFDASLRSTFSTSMRSTDLHDDYEEPLRDKKWQPDIEQIAETNSQSELGSMAELSAASPSDLKEDESAGTTPATPGGTKRFSLKKLPFFKKK